MKQMNYNSRGFSFIEVLVTLVLLTIGVLGMVAMQGRGIQLTSDSVARNNAVMLATDLLEKMRANPARMTQFALNELPDAGACEAEEPNTPVQADDVKRQLACWSQQVRTLLPGTDGDGEEAKAVRQAFRVCRSKKPGECSDGSAVEIQVAWRSNGEACGTENNDARFICRFTLRGEL